MSPSLERRSRRHERRTRKEYAQAEVIHRMSYKEAIELSHFGAKVIHPKTIKPIQNKQIPLYVKSFLFPGTEGTVIQELEERLSLPPIYINKENQLLLTLTPRDFSFIAEEKLSQIFGILAKYKLKLNLMQNSAISFSSCIDNHEAILTDFIKELQKELRGIVQSGRKTDYHSTLHRKLHTGNHRSAAHPG